MTMLTRTRSIGVGALVAALAAVVLAAVPAQAAKPGAFPNASVSLKRGADSITVSWPAIKNATYYTVVWVANNRYRNTSVTAMPTSPAACYNTRAYCNYYTTKTRSVTLSSARLTIPGAKGTTVSNALGNTVTFRVFARSGSSYQRTADASFKPTSSRTTGTDWTPHPAAQLPLPVPPGAGQAVKVSSFNVLAAAASASSGRTAWSTRRTQVARQIEATGSSIIGAQEASNAHTNVPGGNTSQFADLLKVLGDDWALADDRSWRGFGPDGTQQDQYARNNPSSGTRIYYRPSVWRPQARGVFLTGILDQSKVRDEVQDQRIVSWVKLAATADPATQLCVMNAHLYPNAAAANDYAVAGARRAVETKQVIESTLQNRDSEFNRSCLGVPTAFTGDLNVSQHHVPYGNQPVVDLVKRVGFIDTKNAGVRLNTRFTGTGPVGQAHATYGTQIDYVLAKGAGGATAFRVNYTAPTDAGSDHFPVTALFNVPPRPAG